MNLPWLDLADAYDRLRDAERELDGAADDFDRAVAHLRLTSARQNLLRAQEHMGRLASAIFHAAAGGFAADGKSFVMTQTWRLLADAFGVGCALEAADDAKRWARYAEERVRRLLDEIEMLNDRVRELEERLNRLTPGIGEPGTTLRLVR